MPRLEFLLIIVAFLVTQNLYAYDCSRNYKIFTTQGQADVDEIRLINGTWEIGTGYSEGLWSPLDCKPALSLDFFHGDNGEALAIAGEAHLGTSAALVLYPSEQVPDGVTFSVNPQDLFGVNRLEIPLPEEGEVFLDRRIYEQFRTVIGGVNVEIDSEPSNPAKDSAIQTLDLYTKLFPHRAESMREQGQITVVLARNSTEKFQSSPLWNNGFHNPQHLYSVLFSQDGTGVLEHSFHEIGGLFRILGSHYAQGLTWTVAYDLMEKLAATQAEKHARQCLDLERVISSIQDTATAGSQQDYSRSIEYYIVDDVYARHGWPMYAWGSAYYWKKINSLLETQGLPTIYNLIDSIHQYGLDTVSGDTDLDKLLSAYQRINTSGSKVFSDLAIQYFRTDNLGQLLNQALSDQRSLGCSGSNTTESL